MADATKGAAGTPDAPKVETPKGDTPPPAKTDAAPPETKTDEGTKPEPASKDGTPPKAPEKYDFKVPDTGKPYVGAADLKFFDEVARANDWTQAEAQAELELHVDRAAAREKELATEAFQVLDKDPDYGGDKLPQTQQLAQRAIDHLLPEGHKLREAFLAQWARPLVKNNVLYVGLLAEVGRMLSEDATQTGRSSGGGGKTAEDTLYDHPTSRALQGQR